MQCFGRWQIPLLFAVVAALLASGCGSDDSKSDTGVTTFTIGVEGAFSGEVASYGDRLKGGILYALDKAGPVEADGKRVTVKLVYADDEGTPEKGPIAAQQLIDDGVDAVLGPAFSGPAAAAIPLLRAAEIPAVSSAGADKLSALGGGWYFRVALRNACQAQVIAKIAKGQAATSMAIVDDNEAYGTDISKSLVTEGRQLGLTVTGPYHGASGQTDWSPIIQRLVRDKPDVVVYNGYFTEAGRLIQQARDRGFSAPFLGSDGVAEPGIFKVAPAAKLTNVGGVTVTPPGILDGTESSAWKQFQSDYPAFARRKGLETTEPDIIVAEAFDAMNLLLGAVKRTGDVSGSAIREALHGMKADGITGPFQFTDAGEREGCYGGYRKIVGTELLPAPVPGA